MSTYRTAIRFICLTFALALPISALAGNFEVKALIDTDNSRSTGCTVSTPAGIVTGIDVILTTAGTVTGNTGSVTAVTRQTCSGGSLGLPTAVDAGGWNVGVSPTGDLFIESHFGRDLITMDNIRTPRFVFTASSGTLADVLLTPYSWGGGDIVMWQAARDRAVATTPPRAITLDGNSSDWAGNVPLGNGTQTVPAWRFISASAYAGSHDLFFAFAIHTNPGAPTAIDDHYALGTLGGTLTVATLGVQNNDNPNFQPVTSVKTDNPQHGTVTLAGDGGFTYVHDGSFASQDQFHYVLNGTTLQSNIATVTIDLPGNRQYAFTSANNTTFVAGQFNSFQVTVTGKPTPSLTVEGNLPAGVSFVDNGNGTGTLSGTPGPNTAGNYDIVFHAEKNKPFHISQNFTLTVVCPGITITNPSVTTGTAGTPFSQTFTQSGGQAPVTFALNSGTLPTGLSLSSAGVLSGTPTQSGTFPITVKLTDNASCMSIGPAYNLVIACHTVTVTNPATSTGTANVAFSQTFTQSGAIGGATFSLNSGTLPTGLTLSSAGLLSGTPTQTGSFPITVRVTDGQGCTGVGPTYNLVINCQTITVTNPATNTGTANSAFSQTFTAANTIGATTFSLGSGTLPTGLSLSTAGVLSGTPTQTGSFSITVKATDANGCFGVGATYTLTIACQIITVTNPATNTGTVNAAFSQSFSAGNTIGATSFSLNSGTLPTGLTLSSAGVLSGTPTQTGSFSITVKATDANGCTGVGAAYNLTIGCQVITVTNPSTNSGTVNASFSATFTAGNTAGASAFSINSGTLPTGLTLSSGGVLSGTPTQKGSFSITVKVTDGNNCTGVGATYNLTIGCQVITVTNPSTTSGQTGVAFNQSFTSSNTVGTVTYATASTLPTGFTLASNGTLSGTTTQTGNFPIVVTATDANTCSGNGPTYNLVINQPPAITSANNTTFKVGQAGTFTVTTTGFPTNASMLISETGSLPAGVTFVNNNNGTATLAGTPNGGTGGTYSLTITANNGVAPSASQSFTLTVNQAPAITTGNSATFQVGQAGTFTVSTTGFPTNASMVISESGALPGGVTFVNNNNGTATISGTPNALTGNTYAIIITANNGVTPNATQNFTLTVNDPPQITSANSATFTPGVPTTFTVTTTGFPTGASMLISKTGTLPSGVTFVNNNDGTATISGTTSGTGDFPIVITANNGISPNATQNFTVHLNTPPTVSAGGTLNYTENQVATAIDTTVTPADSDGTTLASATVQITSNYVNGQDILGFSNQNGISGSFAAATGTLTLTGTSSIANYQTALRSVTYFNNSDNPSSASRTVSWIVNDGAANSNTATSTINVTPVNDAPVLTAGGTLNYTENQVATAIDNTITVSDPDNANMASATVQLTTNYVSGQDILGFSTQNGITGNFVAGTGTLTLTGSSSVANYQTALRSVTYFNNSDNPSGLARTVVWTVNDGAANSNQPTSTINVTPVNDAPVLTAGGTLNYTENQVATAIDNSITVSDVDNANMASATVQLTTNYVNGQDILGFSTQNGITGNFVAGTGTLTLTGSSSVANYQTALRSVTYFNNSDNPSGSSRTVVWTVNDGTANSNQPTSTINVTPVNDAPVIVAGNTLAYTENQAASALSPALTLTDVDSTNITGASAQITGNYVSSEDVLTFANTANITGSYNATNGTMTLSGTDTVANYQAALRTIKYNNTSENPSASSRTVTWNATDGTTPATPVTSSITVTPVNDPPVLTAGGTLNYTENDVPSVIDNTITVSDVDNANMASATVQLTTNYVSGQDILGFTTQNGITGNFVAGTGTLTLTGSSSVANYQTALRSVTYFNNSDNPSGLSRTVVWTVNDGSANSNQPTSTVNVTPVNDAPTITRPATISVNEDTQFTFTGGNAITVADVDAGAGTVNLTIGATNGTITLTTGGGAVITNNGTASVTASGTIAQLNAALTNSKYQGVLNFYGSDTISINVNDNGNTGTGGALQANASITVTVNPVNDPPVAFSYCASGCTGGVLPAQAGIKISFGAGKLGGTDEAHEVTDGSVVSVVTTPDTTCAGCTLVINANGSFDFTPPPSAAGTTVTFTYHVSDTGFPAPGVSGTPATVTFNVAGPAIYFVKNPAVGAADCKLGSECTFATAVTNIGVSTNAIIFMEDANSHTPGAVTLNSGGMVIGQGVTGVSFDNFFSINASPGSGGTLAARPSINQTRPTLTNAPLTLNTNSQARGFNISTNTGSGLIAATKTGLVVSDMDISTSAGSGNFGATFTSTSTGTFTFGNVTATGNAGGLNFNATTSGSTVTANNITTGAGPAFTAASTGATDFTFNNVTSTTGTAVTLTTTTGDFIFHAISANGAATGVNVSSATGTFTVNGTSPTAASGGTIQNCTGNGMKFVSSNNITLKFMNLNNNGTVQTVTGASTSCGGNLVSNNNLSCVANLFLQTVTGATLTNLSITNSGQQGINGNGVSGLSITNGTITGNGDEAQENGILIQDLTGTNLIQDTTIKDNTQHQVYIENGSGSCTLNVNKNTGSTYIGNTTNPASGGDHAFQFNLHGTASGTLQIDTITVSNNGQGNAIQSNVQGSSSLNGYAQNSTFNNAAAAFNIQNNNSATIDFNILNNPTMTGMRLQAINVGTASGSTGSVTSKIDGNHIGISGTLGSACDVPGGNPACSGITINRFGTNTFSITVSNNLIYQVGNNGLQVNTDFTGSVAMKVTGNTIGEPYPPSGFGVGGPAMYLNFGTSASASGQAVCLQLGGLTAALKNTITESSNYPPYGWDPQDSAGRGSFGTDIFVWARNSAVVSIANYSGGNTTGNVISFVNSNNTQPQGSFAKITNSGSYANGPASCSTP